MDRDGVISGEESSPRVSLLVRITDNGGVNYGSPVLFEKSRWGRRFETGDGGWGTGNWDCRGRVDTYLVGDPYMNFLSRPTVVCVRSRFSSEPGVLGETDQRTGSCNLPKGLE